jgi:hypothetical protein
LSWNAAMPFNCTVPPFDVILAGAPALAKRPLNTSRPSVASDAPAEYSKSPLTVALPTSNPFRRPASTIESVTSMPPLIATVPGASTCVKASPVGSTRAATTSSSGLLLPKALGVLASAVPARIKVAPQY